MDSNEEVTKPQNLKEGSFKLWLPVGRLCACVCGPPEQNRLNHHDDNNDGDRNDGKDDDNDGENDDYDYD